MDTRKRSIRVLMFPWLAHGHVSPFLELAKSLSKRNFITYLCSSPVNLNPIRETLSPKHSISIKLVDLPIPSTPELPPHRHTTNGLPPRLMPLLKRALDSARPAFSNLLTTLAPDLVIYDFLQPWAPEEARARAIPAVVFFSTGAAVTSYIMHRCFGLTGYPFPEIYGQDDQHGDIRDDDLIRVRECVSRSSEVVLIKTFRELEGKYLDFLSGLTRKRFVPVGPLVKTDREETSRDPKFERILSWLDRKGPRSTVLASFGSEYYLSDGQIREMASGLETSGLNFIWVLRFPDDERRRNVSIWERLPEGFMDRVKGRGIVVEGWIPQQEILSHPSVGGFVSHCGWSSVMEGMFHGVPIVAVPMQLDQPMNGRLVAAAGVGVEARRGGDGRLDGEEVARGVRRVVVEGEEMRRRVAGMREKMMSERREEEEVDGVVEEVVRLCRRRKAEEEGGLGLMSQSSMRGLNVMMGRSEKGRVLSENT